jgi:hypothetical protein
VPHALSRLASCQGKQQPNSSSKMTLGADTVDGSSLSSTATAHTLLGKGCLPLTRLMQHSRSSACTVVCACFLLESLARVVFGLPGVG